MSEAAGRRLGFLRVAAGAPLVRVANPRANAEQILELAGRAEEAGADLLVLPELCLTGYTCGDLFGRQLLLETALTATLDLARIAPNVFSGLLVVGLPFSVSGRLYNTAAVLGGGGVLGVVPKSFIPNYSEFYEQRHFAPARIDENGDAALSSDPFSAVPFGVDLLFVDRRRPEFVFGVEICEDLWLPDAPSAAQALAGAVLLLNLSASDEIVGKCEYRRQLVVSQSGRCVAAYVYAGAGVTESTTDLVFSGHCLVAENGALLAETKRFQRSATLIVADVDLERLHGDRRRSNTFASAPERKREFRRICFDGVDRPIPERLLRSVPAKPFVPSDPRTLADRCEEIFQIQTAGLAKRLETVNPPSLQIGVSGGLDSTLALLAAIKACDLLGRPRSLIHGTTMPGFGTSGATRRNAEELAARLGVRFESIDIRPLCLQMFAALGHRPFGLEVAGRSLEDLQRELEGLSDERRKDLVFENVQARVRTMLLMSRGFVLGTGDLSEQALGWATYNADHMSMYNVNAGVPKTLVSFLVRWAADNVFDGPTRTVLHSIANTPISPELLPMSASAAIQSTEGTIGPFELHDFFLYHFLRFGFGPEKILFLAGQSTFERRYTEAELKGWLGVFLRRFFANQYKRSCMPDGPKVGTVSLSPRGDWRMPSDADAAAWLAELESL